LQGHDQPLDPRAEADRRRGRPADLLDETVVPAAAAERRLRARLGPLVLEGRARVVVEAAHERRRERVRHAVRVEKPANGVELLTALAAGRLADLGRGPGRVE